MFAFRNIDADIEEGEYFSISDYFGGGELFWRVGNYFGGWGIILGVRNYFGGGVLFLEEMGALVEIFSIVIPKFSSTLQ